MIQVFAVLPESEFELVEVPPYVVAFYVAVAVFLSAVAIDVVEFVVAVVESVAVEIEFVVAAVEAALVVVLRRRWSFPTLLSASLRYFYHLAVVLLAYLFVERESEFLVEYEPDSLLQYLDSLFV